MDAEEVPVERIRIMKKNVFEGIAPRDRTRASHLVGQETDQDKARWKIEKD
jgi:hypothetical protein